MKTQAIFCALFILVSYSENIHAQVLFGIKGSYTKAWQTERGITQNQKLGSLSTSFSVYSQLNKYLSFGTEPGLAKRGYIGKPNNCCLTSCNCTLPSNLKIIFDASYIQIPFYAKGYLPLANKSVSIFAKIGFGPSWFAAGTESEIVELGNTIWFNNEATIDFEREQLYRWEWGAYSGIGMDVKAGPGYLNLEIEHYRGLSNISRLQYKNRSIGHSVGYTISL